MVISLQDLISNKFHYLPDT